MPEQRRLHVAFFTSCLGGGGAEKHLLRVANHLPRTRFRVSVVTARAGGSYESELSSDTELISLGVSRMFAAPPALRRTLRALKPDVLCSVLDHANCAALVTILAMRDAPPVVACVQIPPSIEHGRNPSVTQRMLLWGIPRLYRRAAAVIALSEGVKRDLQSLRPMIRREITVIPNAAVDAAMEVSGGSFADRASARGTDRLKVVACGRLTAQKDYPVLLKAFAILRRRVDAELWILGDGELRVELESEAAQLGLSDAIWFAGFQSPPYHLMRQADLFVLSSRWEGFGNVIVEAMALGVPVVATDCPYGPAEIMTPGVNGILVPPGDPAALANAAFTVLTTPSLRDALVSGGLRRAQDFRAERIADAYGHMFAQVVAARAVRAPLSDCG